MNKYYVLLLFIVILACKKDGTPAADPSEQANSQTRIALSGEWQFKKTDKKSIRKSDVGQILNPDGTPVDTVRETTDHSGIRWIFSQLELSKVGSSTNSYEYTIMNSGKRIQLKASDMYDIVLLSKNEMILDLKLIAPGSNGHYTELYYRYYFLR